MPTETSNTQEPSPLAVAVAAELRDAQAAANITVDELARRSHVSRKILTKVLDGTRVADSTQVDAICRALGVPLVDLFMRAEKRIDSSRTPPV